MTTIYLVMRRDNYGQADFFDFVISAHASEESANLEAEIKTEFDKKLKIDSEYRVLSTKFIQNRTPLQERLNLV